MNSDWGHMGHNMAKSRIKLLLCTLKGKCNASAWAVFYYLKLQKQAWGVIGCFPRYSVLFNAKSSFLNMAVDTVHVCNWQDEIDNMDWWQFLFVLFKNSDYFTICLFFFVSRKLFESVLSIYLLDFVSLYVWLCVLFVALFSVMSVMLYTCVKYQCCSLLPSMQVRKALTQNILLPIKSLMHQCMSSINFLLSSPWNNLAEFCGKVRNTSP